MADVPGFVRSAADMVKLALSASALSRITPDRYWMELPLPVKLTCPPASRTTFLKDNPVTPP